MSAASSAITVVSPPSGLLGGRDHRQRAAVAQVAGRGERLARGRRVQPVERVDQHERVAAAGGDALAASIARSTAWSWASAEAANVSAAAGVSGPSCHSRDLLGPGAGEHER